MEGGAAAIGVGELVFEVGDFEGQGFQSCFKFAEGLGEFGRGAVEGGLLVAQGGLEGGFGGLDFGLQVGGVFFVGGCGGGVGAFLLNLRVEAFDLESGGFDAAVDLLAIGALVHVEDLVERLLRGNNHDEERDEDNATEHVADRVEQQFQAVGGGFAEGALH